MLQSDPRITHIVNNSATPPLTEKMGDSRKSEHFRRWQQSMRYAVVHGHSYVHLCSTRDQLADGLTKISNARRSTSAYALAHARLNQSTSEHLPRAGPSAHSCVVTQVRCCSSLPASRPLFALTARN